ncbi:MAG: hypothetical protein VCC67_06880, partial [Myxococcota bacterium]
MIDLHPNMASVFAPGLRTSCQFLVSTVVVDGHIAGPFQEPTIYEDIAGNQEARAALSPVHR